MIEGELRLPEHFLANGWILERNADEWTRSHMGRSLFEIGGIIGGRSVLDRSDLNAQTSWIDSDRLLEIAGDSFVPVPAIIHYTTAASVWLFSVLAVDVLRKSWRRQVSRGDATHFVGGYQCGGVQCLFHPLLHESFQAVKVHYLVCVR